MNDDRSSLSVPSRQSADADISVSGNPAQKQAAANIVRGQIDTIYQNDPHTTGAAPSTPTPSATSKPANQPTAAHYGYAQPTGTVAQTQATPQQRIAPEPGAVNTREDNPYSRTLSHDSPLKTQDSSWQKYHTAWQSYYQQYYERYYTSQVAAAKKSLNDQAEVHRTAAEKLRAVENTEALTPNEAIDDLRQKYARAAISCQSWRRSAYCSYFCSCNTTASYLHTSRRTLRQARWIQNRSSYRRTQRRPYPPTQSLLFQKSL